MKRVTKDPDVRREELIDVAEELFLKNGYEETPVSDIVKNAQVAQGTFYYYFKSKDEILDALTDRYLNEFTGCVEKEVERDDNNAVEKMINAFKCGSRFSLGRTKLMIYLHEEENSLLHLKMERKSHVLIVPLFTKMIEQGVIEGLFHVKYPYEAALLLVGCWDSLFDVEHFFAKSVEEKKKTIEAAFCIMERVLGAKQGSFAEPFLNMEGVYET
ncbi:MAG: TetR/AcrR family transcriptional regulator [Theionarchaea archaeon]|nr:TetR/AcrR family transcriptional regulator [Theionarchaea archaeon]